jgi:integrase
MIPQNPSLPTAHFSYHGRSYTLRKRTHESSAPWYFHVEHQGQRLLRSTQTTVVRQAIRFATELLNGIRWGKLKEMAAVTSQRPVRPEYSTVGEVLAAYRQVAVPYLKPRTIEDSAGALVRIIQEGLGDAPEAAGRAVDCLTGRMVAAFERARLEAAGDAEQARQSALTSVNSYARQARSVFKPTWRRYYAREAKLVLPDVTEFLTEPLTRPARRDRLAPAADLIERTVTGAEKLRGEDPAAYTAWLLGLCSLRRGEIRRAEWSWLQRGNAGWQLVIPAESKSKTRRIPGDLPPGVVEELWWFKDFRFAGRDIDDERFILPSITHGRGGLAAEHRAETILRRVDRFMRSCGWTTQHTVHELRAFYLRRYRDRYGLDAAQAAAGHSDQRTTRLYTGEKSVEGMGITLPLPWLRASAG